MTMDDFDGVVVGLAAGGGAVLWLRHVFMVIGTNGAGYEALSNEPKRNTWILSMVFTLLGLCLWCASIGLSLKEAHDHDHVLGSDEIQEWTVYTIPTFGGVGLLMCYMALDAMSLSRDTHHSFMKVMWLFLGTITYAVLAAAAAVDQSNNFVGATVAAAACLSMGFIICYATIVFGEENDVSKRKGFFWTFHVMSKTLLLAGFALSAYTLGRKSVSEQAADDV